MEIATPFSSSGDWLRCALHAHSTNSDGELEPERLATHYERAGYDVLAITDHWVRTETPSTDHLLVIPSIELNATLDGTDSDAHVLALGVMSDPIEPGRRFPNLTDTVDWIGVNGGIAVLAHTYWSALRHEEFVGCPGLIGLEVYNAGCELEIGRGNAAVHWDEALEQGQLLWGIATDDSHLPGYDSGFAAVIARVDTKSQDAVIDALRTGCFYSTTGPLIHDVTVEEREIHVRCSPVTSIGLISSRSKGSRVNAGRMGYRSNGRIVEQTDSGDLTAASLKRSPHMPYGRIEIIDSAGRRAWTNPLWHSAN